ncbi:Dynein light chain-related protein [Penicillium atrosanguineum]|nr:Dynein light chain-related protein [Penicillium atrosanguineum]
MANPPQRTQQVPQHVTALLSHLTSRPGVQSTLILSRKDGSIIQSTGELAIQEPRPQLLPPTYQPSQAETLAAHITAYVSSASALSISLSKPTQTSEGSDSALNVYGTYGNGTTPQDRDADRDRDEDEVKLLRMRTRKHEIVVVPDRKYLLCVVHDAAHASAGPGPAARMR